jgi:microcystin-dependent protein
MAVVTPTAKAQFIDAAGVPLAGGFLYTYEAGTTTPQATYTDSAASTANSNPIILDSRGEANIWLSSANYKFKLTDANGTEIWTVDNIAAPSTALSPVFSSNVTISANTSGPALLVTQTGAGAAIRVQDSADPDSSPFVVDTTGQVGIGTATPANALDLAGGAIQISTSGGTARTVMSADSTDSIFSVNDDRNFTVKTNAATRLTVNSTATTSTVPVVLPSDPTTALQAATKAYVDLASPAGIIAPFAGTTAPSGWLKCEGQAISRATYATLFAAIGTTWGVGDGSTTFNVPDLRGTFLRGTGTNGTYGTAVGPSVGTYAVDTYLNHSHTATSTDSGHSHGISATGMNGGSSGVFYTLLSPTSPYVNTISGTANISTTVATSTTGGTETKPKNYGVLYIIKT